VRDNNPSNGCADYSLCGWRFRSAICLEGLAAWSGPAEAPVDVELVLGEVPRCESNEDPVNVVVSDLDNAIVVAVNVGRFHVSRGQVIVAAADARASSGAIETTILGPVLGTVSYQRGIRPLHCNTVLIDGQAVALAGRSGAGKSTLAAVLIRRGHQLIADDVLPVLKADGRTLGLPGNQNIRLWTETLTYLGASPDGLRRAADGDRDKYFLPINKEKTTRAWPLSALVWLESKPAEVEELRLQQGMLRARTIIKSTYRQHLAKEFAKLGLASIADYSLPGVKVFEFRRPRGVDLLEAQASAIEALVAPRRA
jgi:hypothetical protein